MFTPLLTYSIAYLFVYSFIQDSYGSWKPGRSWNFIVTFFRTGKSWKRATDPGKC